METSCRIVVGFDSKSETGYAAAAVRVARALGADVEGIFVEELEACWAAQLPFAVVVEPNGRTGPLNPQRLASLFRAAARKTERELEAVARRERVAVTFRVRRGRFLGELISAADPRDVIVVGSARIAPRPVPQRGPVAVVVDEPDKAEQLLDLAAAIARPQEHVVALTVAMMRHFVTRWSAEHPVRVLLRPLEGVLPDELAQAVGRLQGRLLVVSGNALGERGLSELRRRLGCPLVIV